ncbi:hypothetical protein STAS_26610, partial [Striga asiatica]
MIVLIANITRPKEHSWVPIGMQHTQSFYNKNFRIRKNWNERNRTWYIVGRRNTRTPDYSSYETYLELVRTLKVLHASGYTRVCFRTSDFCYQNNHIKLNYLFPLLMIMTNVFRVGLKLWTVVTGESMLYSSQEYTEALKGSEARRALTLLLMENYMYKDVVRKGGYNYSSLQEIGIGILILGLPKSDK